MAERVTINEVGLRDGLQNQPRHVDTDHKVQLLNALLAAGIRHVEATSFVSPKAVPQMADAADLMTRLPDRSHIDYSVLVPNVKGYERAKEAGAHSVAVALSCTETMNRRNINMGLAQAEAVCAEVMRLAAADGLIGRAYLSVAFFCPFEGQIAREVVTWLAAAMFDAGAREVIVADTIGSADPMHVRDVFDDLTRRYDANLLSGHFHDTKGLALANSYAAFSAGIRKFDSSIGGLGGCPFAPGAAGNAATEDLVNMFESAGCATGIDLEKLPAAVAVAEQCTGKALGGRWLNWRRTQQAKQAVRAVGSN
ncbi:MAG: hydroxymethylglutaryl-CoA lyase [Hyphomicrobiales bacterium]|nr:hydroxymethylglutaryl-CoA lyase [Hyphomicrobiales bacterium]